MEKILIVDDDEGMRIFVSEALKKDGYNIVSAKTGEEAISLIKNKDFDLVIMDLRLPGLSGIEAIKKIKEEDPDIVHIVITAYGSKEAAIEATKSGAYDFFTKPVKIDEMRIVIKRALERRRLEREIKNLKEQIEIGAKFRSIIGKSESLREVLELISKVVKTDATVLIYGESGTGKELVAEAIHSQSNRKEKSFIKLNCVAIPEGLLESELFGHEKGSFTGAVGQRQGKFELADGGTIFLDEIGDMSLSTQAKILRVLQEREFERVGGSKPVKVDVRIIAATNKDLWQEVKAKRFREDLFYRLNVFSIYLPPLRDRKEDIPILAEHFLNKFNIQLGKNIKGISTRAMDSIVSYNWLGNVRELENAIERAMIMCEDEFIDIEHFPHYMKQIETEIELEKEGIDEKLNEFERRMIVETLRESGGIQVDAAKALGITERSLWHRIKKLGINVDDIKRQKTDRDRDRDRVNR